MRYTTIHVPDGVLYLGQWSGLLNILPQTGKYILNKGRTGCGGTTLFLDSDIPCIIVSPRITMLLSKHQQYQKRAQKTFLFCSATSGDINKKKAALKDYVNECVYTTPFTSSPQQVPKILVTTDSYQYVAEQLQYMGLLNRFTVLVDEFQCLMTDAAFKGRVELAFLYNLVEVRSICFLSATPTSEEYLNHMDDFKDVDDYFQLEWNEKVKVKPNLRMLPYDGMSVKSICKRIIDRFRQQGYFEVKLIGCQCVPSLEACFFINEVATIIDVIQDNHLDPKEVNVLCSKSNKQFSILKKMGVHLGELCTDAEHPHNRTFTFCTKACFEGVDFYSLSAYTYIFSDSVLAWNRHDVAIDIPQILGRQRLDANPFRYDATLYYRTRNIQSDLDVAKQRIIDKEQATKEWLDAFTNSSEMVQKILIQEVRNRDERKKYAYNYIDIVDDVVNGRCVPKANYLVRNVEIRDWELVHLVYSKQVYLMGAINANVNIEIGDVLSGFMEQYQQASTESQRLRLYCTFLDQFPAYQSQLEADPHIDLSIKQAYRTLGAQTIKSKRYRQNEIEEEWRFLEAKQHITALCQDTFVQGRDYRLATVKTLLQNIYNQLGLHHTAKASELGNYILVSQRQLTTADGKRTLFYHINP